MNLSLPKDHKLSIFSKLKIANDAFNLIYKGDKADRQPIHTVYQGADLFHFDAPQIFGQSALESFLIYAPDFIEFGIAFQLKGFENLPSQENNKILMIKRLELLSDLELKQHPFGFIYSIYNKVIQKLKREAVEDYRIDFEDGFGNKTEKEEDDVAIYVGEELVKAMHKGTLPYSIGIRTKPFTEELKERSIRTIDLLLTKVLQSTQGKIPVNFVIMLPKVTIIEQIEAIVAFLDWIELEYKLQPNSIGLEIMVETTQAVMDQYGTNPLYRFIKAANGRCNAVHFGTYDYTASCGITAAYQEMDHPVCDFAHHMTKVALAHTGIWLSDGATNTLPKGPHEGKLTSQQYQENKQIVHAAWLKGYQNIRHSLWNGYYQGWDLYSAQLPMRYTAVYAFFLESYDDAVRRMKAFLGKSLTLLNDKQFADIAEDAATGQALLNYFLKALNSGAITEAEVMITGLTKEEIDCRSFAAILKNRMQH